MKQIKFAILFFFYLSLHNVYSQNTIGIISNTESSFNGYTLFTKDTETYLINNCGEVIHQWSSNYTPGNSVYLLNNGDLLRACKLDNNNITFGGVGGRVELRDWNGTLLWEFNYSTPLETQHHDIFPMPNGNILMLVATTMSNSEAIQAGRDPNNLTDSILYNEQILEIEPMGSSNGNIIWEWNIKDHLIQDFDNTKDNYGIIADNPQLLDINFLGNSAGLANWLHFNSLQYDANLDQIIISSRMLSEIYIIDHSTTSFEAESHSGGNYGKGGDLLYRWGNPEAYDKGTSEDRQLFGQHYPHFIPEGLPYSGKLIVFNNGFGRTPSFSEVLILNPPTTETGVYTYFENTGYGPLTSEYFYFDSNNIENFFSRFLSSAQKLPNGNTLICSGANGYVFEINELHEKVWEYILPIGTNGVMTQGDDPINTGNTLFRALKYETTYSAFEGKSLTPGNPIEFNPDLSNCTALNKEVINYSELKIYPNPVKELLHIKTENRISKINVYTLLGQLIIHKSNSNQINFKNLSKGIYIVKIYTEKGNLSKMILKE